jgi:flagellar motor switch protein FliN/FliY
MEKEQVERDNLDAVLKKIQGAAGAQRPASSPFAAVEAAEEGQETGGATRARPNILKSIHLKVRAELGRTRLQLKEALQLGPGAIVDLEKFADDPVDLYVGDLLIGRGEVLVINDSFCIRVTEVFSQPSVEEET